MKCCFLINIFLLIWDKIICLKVNSRSLTYYPEVSMTIEQLINKNGYRYEIHTVSTSDGYILKLFRILPNKPISRVVLLQHGLFV